jgi:hypothetical protein
VGVNVGLLAQLGGLGRTDDRSWFDEHILSRLLTLVTEKALTPDDLAIYAFEKDEKGECSANQIRVFEDGRVEGGIKDFFDTNVEELNRYVKAFSPGSHPRNDAKIYPGRKHSHSGTAG